MQFAICWALAKLEIHIEGGAGWAENLPTWRWGPEWFLNLSNGKPVTGYHVYMNLLLLLFLHYPLVGAWTPAGEARALSVYFQFAFVWDFLWFMLNPAFGWRRFRRGEVWWFRRWLGRFPADYYTGAALSLVFGALAGPWQVRGFELILQIPLVFFATLAGTRRTGS